MTFVLLLWLFVVCAVCECEFGRCNANVESSWFDARNEAASCARVALFDCALWRDACACHRRRCACNGADESCAQQQCDAGAVSPKRSVAVISTTVDDLYLFFTPLTSLIWSYLMDYDVACVLVGPDPRQSPLHFAVLNATLRVGVDVFWIPSVPDVPDATASQVARLFVPLLYADDTYVLTSDNDMWNLDRAHFAQRDADAGTVMLFYGNAYPGRVPPMYPICYIGMRAALWRTIMSNAVPALLLRGAPLDLDEVTRDIIRAGERRYGAEWNTANKAVSPRWYYDQILFGEAIDRWPGHPSKCRIVVRRPGLDRLDRGRWQFRDERDLAGKIDAHLLRPGFNDENWPRLQRLWAALFRGADTRFVQFAASVRDLFITSGTTP